MEGAARFRLNSPQVIAETIEGEAVMVDLSTGSYYSVRDAGAAVWDAIAAGASVERIVSGLVEAFDVDPAAAAEQITAFVEELEREGLVVPADEAPSEPALDLRARAGAGSFAGLALEKFTDMQDLVLIDPVHEVDERGWPHARSTT